MQILINIIVFLFRKMKYLIDLFYITQIVQIIGSKITDFIQSLCFTNNIGLKTDNCLLLRKTKNDLLSRA